MNIEKVIDSKTRERYELFDYADNSDCKLFRRDYLFHYIVYDQLDSVSANQIERQGVGLYHENVEGNLRDD